MGRVFPNHHELIRIFVGEGTQQDAVDHAEDGAVRSNAEREREDGDGGEGRRAPEHAQTVTDILD